MAFLQLVSSNFQFAHQGRGQTTIGGVTVTMTTTGMYPIGGGIYGPMPDNTTRATVQLSFSKKITEFHLDATHARNDEFISGFNIGLPQQLTGDLQNRLGRISTALPYPNDAGRGSMIWRNLNTNTVTFNISSPGHGATVLPQFSFLAEQNSKPVANIYNNGGGVNNVEVGSSNYVMGDRSSDADRERLSYRWRVTEQPGGSQLSLSNQRAKYVKFAPKVAGAYIIELIVSDGKADSTPAYIRYNVSTGITAPTASVMAGDNPIIGQLVTIDNVNVSDLDGDALSYKWTLVTPAGSQVALNNLTVLNPSFTPDVIGTYTAKLVVTDAHGNSAQSQASWIAKPLPNKEPVAHLGRGAELQTGETIFLDGTASFDLDGDALSYHWSVITKPQGSHVSLENARSVQPPFTPDIDGEYVISLTVSDGKTTSAPALVTYTSTNHNNRPIACIDAGYTTVVGTPIKLSGRGSFDLDGDQLAYVWTLHAPNGSAAELDNFSAANPTFTPDVEGVYTASLVVNDGQLDSEETFASWPVDAKPEPGLPRVQDLTMALHLEGGARKEFLVLTNDGEQNVDMSGIVLNVPTAQRRAKKHSHYAFEDGFELAPGASVRVDVYPGAQRSFGSKLPLFNDDKLCIVNVDLNGETIAASITDPDEVKGGGWNAPKRGVSITQFVLADEPAKQTSWDKLTQFWAPFAFMATKGATPAQINDWQASQNIQLSDEVKALVAQHGTFRLPMMYLHFTAETVLSPLSAWQRFDQSAPVVDGGADEWVQMLDNNNLPSSKLEDYVLIGTDPAGADYGRYVILHTASNVVYSIIWNEVDISSLGSMSDWIANKRLPVQNASRYPSLWDFFDLDDDGIAELVDIHTNNLEDLNEAGALADWHKVEAQFIGALKAMV